MGSLVQGQAVGGIITALINILSIEFSTDPSHSAFYCFLVAAIFIALDTVAFLAMNKSPFYKVNTSHNTLAFQILIIYLVGVDQMCDINISYSIIPRRTKLQIKVA